MTPRCPFCNAQGINQIEAQDLGPALLLFCKKCGAIHGVIPAPKKKQFEIKPLEEIEAPDPQPPAPDSKPLTPRQAALMQRTMVQKATPYRIYLSGDQHREGET